MKERPILFSTPMVQALDAGTKTMTRRTTGLDLVNDNPDGYQPEYFGMDSKENLVVRFAKNRSPIIQKFIKCPYGMVGDFLWVRETFGIYDHKNRDTFYDLSFVYKAQCDECGQFPVDDERVTFKERWKPSIHMPKDAARIWLKITDIRVERLQDISTSDALAEGIEVLPPSPIVPKKKWYKIYDHPGEEIMVTHDPIVSFFTLWTSINGENSVKDNPWVWVVVFEKVDAPIIITS